MPFASRFPTTLLALSCTLWFAPESSAGGVRIVRPDGRANYADIK